MGVEADRDLTAIARSVPGGRIFWAGVLAGWAVIAYGIWGTIFDAFRGDHGFAIWLIGGLLAHDLFVAPIVFVSGVILKNVIGARYRAIVYAALIVSAIFVLTSIPMLGRFGARRDNPTALPGNYTAGLLVLLVIVWAISALFLLRAWRHGGGEAGAVNKRHGGGEAGAVNR